jgi:hypothetical protein
MSTPAFPVSISASHGLCWWLDTPQQIADARQMKRILAVAIDAPIFASRYSLLEHRPERLVAARADRDFLARHDFTVMSPASPTPVKAQISYL